MTPRRKTTPFVGVPFLAWNGLAAADCEIVPALVGRHAR
jgi:hypothetical protein